MSLGPLDVPIWVLDWSGSLMVIASLLYLWSKRPAYWHWSNASLVPYFVLFVSTQQLMLAGLQVSYLIFGVHGLWLWRLERRRREVGTEFSEQSWYAAGWVLTLAIFAVSIRATDFVDGWAWFQFAIVSASLLANLATTRTWLWSWYLWIAVNVGQAIYFAHLGLWAQFGLQFVLGAMSIEGIRRWRAEPAHEAARPRATALGGPLDGLEPQPPGVASP